MRNDNHITEEKYTYLQSISTIQSIDLLKLLSVLVYFSLKLETVALFQIYSQLNELEGTRIGLFDDKVIIVYSIW